MGKKILYSDFESTHDILENLLKKMQMKKQSKVFTLSYAWKDIVGVKMSELSKPIGVAQDKTLIVACKNPMVSQELYLNKTQILKSAKFYAESMHLQVENVCFSHKIWDKYKDNDKEE